MEKQLLDQTGPRRRGEDIVYWTDVCATFSVLYEEVKIGRSKLSVDVDPILDAMISARYPFTHRRSQDTCSLGRMQGDQEIVPLWAVIGHTVIGVLDSESLNDLQIQGLQYVVFCGGKRLRLIMRDYSLSLSSLQQLNLLGEQTSLQGDCSGFLDTGQHSCSCSFHQNSFAVKGFRAKNNLLRILPDILSNMRKSLGISHE